MGILHHKKKEPVKQTQYNKTKEKTTRAKTSKNKLLMFLIILLGVISLFQIQNTLSSSPSFKRSISSNKSYNYVDIDKLIEECRNGKYGSERHRAMASLAGLLPQPSSGLSNILQPGELLHGIIPPKQDYRIRTNSSLNKITLQFWDYADVDGDYIQIFQNGSAITEPFKITHTIKNIVIENNGVIQVKGIKDGQNGITYGVKFESGAACINIIEEGEINTYTIIH